MKYGKNIKFKPEILDPNSIDRLSTSLIPENTRVLDIGCATGFMGEYLKKNKKCIVVGIEMSKDEARVARKKLDSVIEGDVETLKTIKSVKGKFDVILASALIEHLRDPFEAVRKWRSLLKKDGFLIVTTPNISHWSIRKNLLFGKFEYQEYGILDNTHLHFFTTETFKDLFEKNGYKMDVFMIDSVGGGYPRISKFLSRFFPNLFAYQMVIKAYPK